MGRLGTGRKAQGDETTLADRKRRAGQRIVMGLAGPAVSADERRAIREIRPAGFILFARNVAEPAQVLDLNRELQSLLPERLPPLLSVDQEGGRVLRIKNTRWPAMRTVGNLEHLATTREVAVAMATELRAMGFNLNFAPVADVDSNPRNPVIGDRAFGRDPAWVAQQVVAFAAGLQSEGIIACVKHFPGHGDTDVDSHKALPVVDKELYDLQNIELIPFRAAVEAGVGMVMTSHVLFPALDDDHPATMSRKILHRLLRQDLGFDGVVISDDLEMKAVRGRWRIEQVLDRASRASVDLFCIGRSFEHDLSLSFESWEVLIRQQEAEPGHDKQARSALRRLQTLRETHLLNLPSPADLSVIGSAAYQAFAADLHRRGAGQA